MFLAILIGCFHLKGQIEEQESPLWLSGKECSDRLAMSATGPKEGSDAPTGHTFAIPSQGLILESPQSWG